MVGQIAVLFSNEIIVPFISSLNDAIGATSGVAPNLKMAWRRIIKNNLANFTINILIEYIVMFF